MTLFNVGIIFKNNTLVSIILAPYIIYLVIKSDYTMAMKVILTVVNTLTLVMSVYLLIVILPSFLSTF